MQFEDILTRQTYPLLKDMLLNYDKGQLKGLKEQYKTFKEQMNPEEYGSYLAHLFGGLTTVVMDAARYKEHEKQKEIFGAMSDILQDYYSKVNLGPYREFRKLKNIVVGSKELSLGRVASVENESAADEIEDMKRKKKETKQKIEEMEKISDIFTFSIGLQTADIKSFDNWLDESYNQ